MSECKHPKGFIQFRDRPQEWFCPDCETYERDYRNECLAKENATLQIRLEKLTQEHEMFKSNYNHLYRLYNKLLGIKEADIDG